MNKEQRSQAGCPAPESDDESLIRDTSPQRGTCSGVVDLLVHYLEDRLPAGTRAELEQHLTTCSACVAQLNTYRSTVSLLRSLRDDDLPAELRDSVDAFLRQQTNH